MKVERRLTLVPVIFVLVRIWGTIRFILYLSDRDNPNTSWEKVLLYFQVCFFINKATMPINCVIGDHSKKLSQVSN